MFECGCSLPGKGMTKHNKVVDMTALFIIVFVVVALWIASVVLKEKD